MVNLDNLKLEQWWKVLTIAGVALSIAAMAAKDKDFLLLSIGFFFFGLGEWINHPKNLSIGPFMGRIFTVEGHPWKPSIFGLFWIYWELPCSVLGFINSLLLRFIISSKF